MSPGPLPPEKSDLGMDSWDKSGHYQEVKTVQPCKTQTIVETLCKKCKHVLKFNYRCVLNKNVYVYKSM